MVGKTGAGKSSSANTILGEVEAFKVECSPNPVTMTSSKKSREIVRDNFQSKGVAGDNIVSKKVAGYNIEVIDTPGLFGNSDNEEDEIKKCIEVSAPGPHAFLLVIRLGRFTEEEGNAVKWIQDNFGEKASDFTILLFTGGADLGKKSIDNFIAANEKLKKVKEDCKGGHFVFENNDILNRKQVKDLMQIVEKMWGKNGKKHYTNKMYEEAQRKIEEENKKKQQEEEKKKKEYEEKIRADEREKIRIRDRGCIPSLKNGSASAGMGATAGVGVGGAAAVVTACVVEAAVAAIACPALLVAGVVLGFATGLGYHMRKR
ncbi:GTPase IMAP family member 9-like isoform X2 [Alosa pseudoharengus]